jgi:CDGSH-type Zn-finger protein
MSDTEIKISIKPNGPLRVESVRLPTLDAVVTLVDTDGTEFDLTGKPGISLCRCGASANKPFCDGSHGKIGFQAADPSALPKK